MFRNRQDKERNKCFSDEASVDNFDTINFKKNFQGNKKGLSRVSQQLQNTNSYDSEEEVMKMNQEEENAVLDIEDAEENFSLPNDKAWGKSKNVYYSTDYIDADYATTRQQDNAHAEMEEKEARILQQSLAKQLDETDFGLDSEEIKQSSCNFDNYDEEIKADLSKLSNKQKHEFLRKESPEFMPLILDLEKRLTEVKTIIKPFLQFVKKQNFKDCTAINFVTAKYDLLLHYCINISFYLILKSKQETVITHPVTKRLAQYRQLLNQIEKNQGKLLQNIKFILEATRDKLLTNSTYADIKNIKLKKIQKKSIAENYNVIKVVNINKDKLSLDEISDCFEKDGKSLKSTNDHKIINQNECSELESQKRIITYQMAKNRGLTPYRKKEQRNPRVKHRNKYRKAKIRRKGAVREVKRETNRYQGESSGIKASVSKSIKIK